MKCGGEWQQRQRHFLVSHVYYHYFFLKGETKAGKALKSCFFWKRGWGEKVTWELIPYQSLRKKGQIWGAVNYADRGSHEGALPRGLTELKTGGSLLLQSPSEARQYPKHLEQYLIHKKCLTSIC